MERDEVEVVMLRGVERMACRGHVARLTMDNTQYGSMAVWQHWTEGLQNPGTRIDSAGDRLCSFILYLR